MCVSVALDRAALVKLGYQRVGRRSGSARRLGDLRHTRRIPIAANVSGYVSKNGRLLLGKCYHDPFLSVDKYVCSRLRSLLAWAVTHFQPQSATISQVVSDWCR